mmetsp:Transcript_13706/g.40084  ORF Transcript_13706/g.40084 Transcript_13706/m.40084 type:complete len:116 (-) Transcript_13706:46-393(-)
MFKPSAAYDAKSVEDVDIASVADAFAVADSRTRKIVDSPSRDIDDLAPTNETELRVEAGDGDVPKAAASAGPQRHVPKASMAAVMRAPESPETGERFIAVDEPLQKQQLPLLEIS